MIPNFTVLVCNIIMTGEHVHTTLKERIVPDLLFSSEFQVVITPRFQLCSASYTALQMKTV